MNGFVKIERTAQACVLWDGRPAVVGKPLMVAVENAADLIDREPSAWKIADKSEAALVAAEISRRSAPSATASPSFTNVVTDSKGGK
jgi:hypothetical protein